jgi:hypothetical protein
VCATILSPNIITKDVSVGAVAQPSEQLVAVNTRIVKLGDTASEFRDKVQAHLVASKNPNEFVLVVAIEDDSVSLFLNLANETVDGDGIAGLGATVKQVAEEDRSEVAFLAVAPSSAEGGDLRVDVANEC